MKKVLDERETARCLGIPIETHDNSKARHELAATQFEREIPPFDTSADFRFGTGGENWSIPFSNEQIERALETHVDTSVSLWCRN